jgi:hypothetical protein
VSMFLTMQRVVEACAEEDTAGRRALPYEHVELGRAHCDKDGAHDDQLQCSPSACAKHGQNHCVDRATTLAY